MVRVGDKRLGRGRSRRGWSAEVLEPRMLLSGTLNGTAWEDRDGDGTVDEGEAALPGVRVYLDADNDAAFDAGEASATTDAQGRYEFADVAAGRHVVRQATPPAHEQMFPGQGGPTVGGTIEGINYNEDGANNGGNSIPPDPIGAVGPGHVVSVVNTSIEWHTRAGLQQRSEGMGSFFSRLPAFNTTFDPKVIYDQYAGRFVVLILGRTAVAEGDAADTSRILLAVSDDADPNGNWRFAAIDSKLRIDGRDRWSDFPGLAVDEEAVYVTANMVTYAPGLAPPSRLWIVAKEGLYDGASAVAQPAVTVHDPAAAAGLPPEPYVSFTVQPAHVFGEAPAGAGTFLVTVGPGGNELRTIRVDNPLSPSPSFSYQVIPLGELGNIPHSFILPGAPQRGGPRTVVTGPGHIRNAVWRGGALWATMTVLPTSGPDAGQTTAHWVKIDTSDLGRLRVADQGNVGGEELGPGTFTYFSSIAVDGQGNMAMGFSASSGSVFAGAYVTGRRADDPPGTVRPAAPIALGQDYYFRTFGGERNRWGDYSGTVVDPVDDSTFWSFNEYALTRDGSAGEDSGRWGTRWGRFTLPDVSPGGHRIDLSDGQTASGLNFGSRRTTGSIGGTVFDDSDGDGAHDDGEAGLPGRTAYLDLNRNGRLDGAGSATATASAVEVPRATVDAGVAFDGRLSAYLSSSVPGTITDVNVRLSITHPRISDLEVALVSQAGTRVPLVARVGGTGRNFSNTVLDDEAATSIDAGTAPFSGSFRPQSPLSAFDGQPAAGTWRLEVRDVASGFTGTLTDWSLVFTTAHPGEPTSLTNAAGGYEFASHPLGSVNVRQVLPPGWLQTLPGNNTARPVTLAAAHPDLSGVDFGTRRDPTPPRVVELFARGAAWPEPFLSRLAALAVGDGRAGYRLPLGSASMTRLTWVNVDQLVVRFDRPIEPLASHFTVRGERSGQYEVTAVGALAGVPNAYVFTLGSPLGRDGSAAANGDRLTLALDGGSPGGVRSAGGVLLDGDGDGTPGGDFRYEVQVLQGDVNQSGSVLAADYSEVKQKYFRTAANPGSGAGAYSVFHDLDGSGTILADDFAAVKSRFFNRIAPLSPATGLLAGGISDTRRIAKRILDG